MDVSDKNKRTVNEKKVNLKKKISFYLAVLGSVKHGPEKWIPQYKAVYFYPDFIKAWRKQSLVLFNAWKPPFSHISCWWNGLVWVPGLEEQPKDLWRTLPHQRPFDFRGTVPIYLPLICAWIICTHLISSQCLQNALGTDRWPEIPQSSLQARQCGRLEVRYIRRSNNNRFWSKIEPLPLQNPSHR